MQATLNVKISIETATLINDRLKAMLTLHEAEVATCAKEQKKLLINGSLKRVSELNDLSAKLAARGARLTVANMLRVYIERFMSEKFDATAMMKTLEAEGKARGRPRGT